MAYKNTLEVHEIFELVSKAKNRTDRISALQQNATPAIKDILRGLYDDRVQWNLPGGEPPYTPNEPESPPSSLRKMHLNFKYLVKGIAASDSLISVKREKIFLDMLESIHPADAKLMVSVINKKNPVKGLTKKIVQEAIPGLIP
jgi:hypothetical protein